MDDFANTNSHQKFFNQVRGVISELNEAERYCSITLDCGHENVRPVNMSVKRSFFDENIKDKFSKGEKVSVRFYLTSNFHNGRWFTSANVIHIFKDNYDRPSV